MVRELYTHGSRSLTEMYELVAAWIYPDRGYMADGPSVIEETDNVLHLPNVYCRTCKIRYVDDEVPILEGGRLPQDHPLLSELRALAIRAEKEKKRVSRELSRLMGGFPENVPREHPIWLQIRESGTVTPDKFWRMVDEIRRSCSLPVSRRIHPGRRIGELEVNCTRSRVPDLILGPIDGLPVVVTKRTIDVLKDAGCTGFNVYSVKVSRTRGNKPIPALFELEVIGRGGLPGTGTSPWELKECPVCHLSSITSATGTHDGRFAIDSERYDGSDIFCFEHWRWVFVSQRFKDAAEKAKLAGAQFRPLSISRDESRTR